MLVMVIAYKVQVIAEHDDDDDDDDALVWCDCLRILLYATPTNICIIRQPAHEHAYTDASGSTIQAPDRRGTRGKIRVRTSRVTTASGHSPCCHQQ